MASYNSPDVEHRIVDDLASIEKLLQSSAKLDPSDGNTDIPVQSIRLTRKYKDNDISQYDGLVLEEYVDDQWKSLQRMLMDSDTLDGFHASKTSTAENVIPVYDVDGKIAGGIMGEAGTAAKLTTPRSIDIGGLVTADAQNFDGSADITIPVKQITVNNDQDTAINGILSMLHGGTGRNDGVAQDVLVSKAGEGDAFASQYGQVGEAADISGIDINTLVKSGNYIAYGVSYDTHYPKSASNSVVRVKVASRGTYIHQSVVYTDSMYVRSSIDSGASWGDWTMIGDGALPTVKVFVSKSGSDSNLGLDNAHPVLTIQKAVEVGIKNLLRSSANSVTLCIGEGDWGDITFSTLPCLFIIYPYDGLAATEYSETWPKFGTLRFNNCYITIGSIDVNIIYGTLFSFVQTTSGIRRFGRIQGTHNALIYLGKSNEIKSIADQAYVFYSSNNGTIVFDNFVGKIVNNLTLSNSFLRANFNGNMFYTNTAPSFTLDTGVSVTGKRYILNYGSSCNINMTKAQLDTLPGNAAGTIAINAVINGVPWGGGATNKFLAANGTWSTIPTSDAVNLDDSTSIASSKAVKTVYDQVSSLSSSVSSLRTTVNGFSSDITDLQNNKVDRDGDTMTGNLTMSNKYVQVNATNIYPGFRVKSSTLNYAQTSGWSAKWYEMLALYDKNTKHAAWLGFYEDSGGIHYLRLAIDATSAGSAVFLQLSRDRSGNTSIQTDADAFYLKNGSIWIA